MNNFISFMNSFMSYLFVYFVFIACIVIAVFVGIKLRKHKDAKAVKEDAVALIEVGEAKDDTVTE